MQECRYHYINLIKEIYEFVVNGLCNVGKVDAAVSGGGITVEWLLSWENCLQETEPQAFGYGQS